jgi:hypothetical protein
MRFGRLRKRVHLIKDNAGNHLRLQVEMKERCCVLDAVDVLSRLKLRFTIVSGGLCEHQSAYSLYEFFRKVFWGTLEA